VLKDGSKGIEELSKTTGSHGPPLYGVLRALASIGIFAEDEQGRFVLTPLADALRSDVPGSLHAWVNMLSGEKIIVRGVISCTVQTGESAFDHEVEG
jgi:hypothetical protein